MKTVSINADDFGLSRSINEAVFRAHRQGILTGASLLANGPAVEDALAIARENPGLEIGMHFNLYRGRPLRYPEEISSLVDAKTGTFLGSLPKIIGRISKGEFREEEVYLELKAQAERVLAAGICPTHADSEKHIHHFPVVAKTVTCIAKELGIRRIRAVREPLSIHEGLSLLGGRGWTKCLARVIFARARRTFVAAGLRVPIRTYGYVRPMTRDFLRQALLSVPEGMSEIICHPGLVGPEYRIHMEPHGSFFVQGARRQELEALMDPSMREIVRGREIRLGEGIHSAPC